MKYLILLIIGFVITLNSCEKEECDKVSLGVYEFVLPFELSPAQETYHIGDTITIKSIITNPIYERKTAGQTHTFINKII